MKLYQSAGACSLAPIIIAEWLGVELDIEAANIRSPDPEYLAKNPMGAVPALELDDGEVFTQVDAILRYICRQKPGTDLMGRNDREELALDMWSAFLTGDFHPAFGGYFRPKRFTRDHSDEAVAATREAFVKRIHKVAGVLDQHIGDADHVALGRRTFLDGYMYAMARWMRNMDGGLSGFPSINRLMNALDEDPGVQRALEREKSGS